MVSKIKTLPQQAKEGALEKEDRETVADSPLAGLSDTAFEKHENETEEHVARLEKVFEEIDETPRDKTCDAIMGIIEEGQEVMKEFKGAPALDAGLLAAAQAVEHYEIARYGTLKTWASELGLNQAVKLLDMTLGEEKKTDETLTKLAQSEVNQHAQAA
jgi:ferritin-like metal-binding protein YciE